MQPSSLVGNLNTYLPRWLSTASSSCVFSARSANVLIVETSVSLGQLHKADALIYFDCILKAGCQHLDGRPQGQEIETTFFFIILRLQCPVTDPSCGLAHI